MKNNILIIGEILYDYINNSKILGGAAFNVAYNLHRFNVPISFLSAVGQDKDGKEITNTLKNLNFPIDFISQNNYPTGKVIVKTNGITNNFEIINNVAYDHINFSKVPFNYNLLYFNSLLFKSEHNKMSFKKFLKKTNAIRFCDLNLRAPFYNETTIKEIISLSSIIKVNEEEWKIVKNILNITNTLELFQIYPNIKIFIITLGKEGAQIITSKGNIYKSSVAEEINIQDTVGCGDMFSAAFIYLWFIKKIELSRVINLCTLLATYNCSIKGAITLDNLYYENLNNIINNYLKISE